LVESAAIDYHNFYNPDLRAKRLKFSSQVSARADAERARRWIRGEPARYPFSLAAAWLNWDADVLADYLLSGRTGENLLLQAATTEKNKHRSPEDRLASFLGVEHD